MKRLLLTLALVVGILFTAAWAQQPRPQWEYKIEYKLNDKKANALGAEGWELVAVGSFSSGTIIMEEYIFKRAK